MARPNSAAATEVETTMAVEPMAPFGAVVTGLSESDLRDAAVQERLREAWLECGGLIVIRGLVDLSGPELVDFSAIFGHVEESLDVNRSAHPDDSRVLVLRTGTTAEPGDDNMGTKSLGKDATGSMPPPLPPDGDCTYNPATRQPVWHTDSLYRKSPPIGSAFYCKEAPPEGAGTCFADMVAAYAALPEARRQELEGLESVCSLAHHDTKLYRLYHNDQLPPEPLLSEEQRAANPPTRCPLVLRHPQSGRKALSGLNSSTCRIVPTGHPVSAEEIEEYELGGKEHPSVEIWRTMLPEVTTREYALVWQWQAGDLACWDNRCLIHAGTGFDRERYVREMWRTVITEPTDDERSRL